MSLKTPQSVSRVPGSQHVAAVRDADNQLGGFFQACPSHVMHRNLALRCVSSRQVRGRQIPHQRRRSELAVPGHPGQQKQAVVAVAGAN